MNPNRFDHRTGLRTIGAPSTPWRGFYPSWKALCVILTVFASASAFAGEWSEWQTIQGDEAGGVDISFKWGTFEYDGGNHAVYCRLQNRYGSPVDFSIDIFTIDAAGATRPPWWVSAKLGPGEVKADGGWYTIAGKVKGYRLKQFKQAGSSSGVNELVFPGKKTDASRREQERLQAERAEAQRHEQERIQAERAEAQRREQERLEYQRRERERLREEQLEAQRLERERRQEAQMQAQYERQQREEERRNREMQRILEESQRTQDYYQGQAKTINEGLENIKNIILESNTRSVDSDDSEYSDSDDSEEDDDL